MAATNLIAGADSKPKRGFGRFWNTLKQLFHELVGGVFAVLSLAWLQSAVRAWTRDVAHWLVAVACAVAVVLAVFSWTSFRRARQLQRQTR
jgi:ABC-type Fe3+ transport system permease subunit